MFTQYKIAKPTLISIPIPPPDPKLVFKVKSTWQERFYLVDISNQICTCDNFLGDHGLYVAGNIQRCCRHLLRAYSYERVKKIMVSNLEYQAIPEYVWALIRDQRAIKEIWAGQIFGSPIVFTKSKDETEWLNVFLRKKRRSDATELRSGEYEKFGYSLVQHRWSFSSGPKGASNAVREMIENTFT